MAKKKENRLVVGDAAWADTIPEWEEHEFEELKDMIYHSRGGEINHPVLNAMRQLKKEIKRKERKGD